MLGVGYVPTAEDSNDAFLRLNWMLAQWQRKRWLVWHLVDLAVPSTGATSYTIGPGGNINVAVRPDKLEAAYTRQIIQSQPNQIDYPVDIITSYEQYSRIALKQLTAFTSYIFYDNAYPVGKLYPWPVPQASIYETHVLVKDLLSQFTGLTQQVNIPEEYFPALEWNLAVRLAAAYPEAGPPREDLKALARDSLNVLREANTQIATLAMPTELVRPGVYNPYSDQVR